MVHKSVDDSHLLVSLSNTNGQNFILKLSVVSNALKVLVTDKSTAERWKCSYDSSYLENLTRKTGNFKQFSVFVSMLKAGLLKTNECVFVELVTQDELESRRKRSAATSTNYLLKNRKYLILVYQVEFDKIHYPLPLEYCGKPDPEILQGTIRRLENDMSQVRCEMTKQLFKCRQDFECRELSFQKLIAQLNQENKVLYEENKTLKAKLGARLNVESQERKKFEIRTKPSDMGDLDDRLYRLEIENSKLTSILQGRARTRIPIKVSKHRSTSLPRTSSSGCLYDCGSGKQPNKRAYRNSPSPARKTSTSSSEKVEPPALRKSRSNSKVKLSSSSDKTSSKNIRNKRR